MLVLMLGNLACFLVFGYAALRIRSAYRSTRKIYRSMDKSITDIYTAISVDHERFKMLFKKNKEVIYKLEDLKRELREREL